MAKTTSRMVPEVSTYAAADAPRPDLLTCANMTSRLACAAALALSTAALSACGPSAGDEGSRILVDYENLSGGVVFASRAVSTASGYDLFWAPVPAFQTVAAQPLFQLTDSGENEWQPSVSPGGNGLAYARPGDGIFYVGTDSRVRRVSSPSDRFVDSLPAVSHDGAFVAWVREDTARPIGSTGFFDTKIMLARSDGSDPRELAPAAGVVQDAPRFEPRAGSFKIAWSEFAPESIDATGPTVYGLRVFDFRTNIGERVCSEPAVNIDGTIQRCFGQHLAWPRPDVLIVTQSFFEVFLDGSPFNQVYSNLLTSVSGQQFGAPVFEPTAFGYTWFPISASYLGNRMIFDGVITSVQGDLATLSLWVASVDGTGPWRLQLDGHLRDIDLNSTRNYLFSVATPQLIP